MPEYKYVYGKGRTALNLTELDIRYAMENSKSNAEAARFSNCSFTTYKKYARLFIDEPTGKSLFDLHKNQAGKGINKHIPRAARGRISLENVLKGLHPTYPSWKLRNRLLALGMIDESCSMCGFNEKRFTDDTVPLLLDHIDSDDTNHKLENLRMLCFNCTYLLVGNLYKKDRETLWNYNKMD